MRLGTRIRKSLFQMFFLEHLVYDVYIRLVKSARRPRCRKTVFVLSLTHTASLFADHRSPDIPTLHGEDSSSQRVPFERDHHPPWNVETGRNGVRWYVPHSRLRSL